MQRNIKKIFILVAGIIFILFGLIGLVLPFLQGIIFLAIGLILVSFCFPKVRLWMHEHTKQHPRLSRIVTKAEIFIKKLIGDL